MEQAHQRADSRPASEAWKLDGLDCNNQQFFNMVPSCAYQHQKALSNGHNLHFAKGCKGNLARFGLMGPDKSDHLNRLKTL
jgi:hypothetical protein